MDVISVKFLFVHLCRLTVTLFARSLLICLVQRCEKIRIASPSQRVSKYYDRDSGRNSNIKNSEISDPTKIMNNEVEVDGTKAQKNYRKKTNSQIIITNEV